MTAMGTHHVRFLTWVERWWMTAMHRHTSTQPERTGMANTSATNTWKPRAPQILARFSLRSDPICRQKLCKKSEAIFYVCFCFVCFNLKKYFQKKCQITSAWNSLQGFSNSKANSIQYSRHYTTRQQSPIYQTTYNKTTDSKFYTRRLQNITQDNSHQTLHKQTATTQQSKQHTKQPPQWEKTKAQQTTWLQKMNPSEPTPQQQITTTNKQKTPQQQNNAEHVKRQWWTIRATNF